MNKKNKIVESAQLVNRLGGTRLRNTVLEDITNSMEWSPLRT
jgi:hypothetical protein